jgi:hypothetical protein
MVSGDVEDDLAFMAGGQLGWTTGSCVTEGVVALSEFLEVLLGMLVMLLISSKECRPPWTASVLKHLRRSSLLATCPFETLRKTEWVCRTSSMSVSMPDRHSRTLFL